MAISDLAANAFNARWFFDTDEGLFANLLAFFTGAAATSIAAYLAALATDFCGGFDTAKSIFTNLLAFFTGAAATSIAAYLAALATDFCGGFDTAKSIFTNLLAFFTSAAAASIAAYLAALATDFCGGFDTAIGILANLLALGPGFTDTAFATYLATATPDFRCRLWRVACCGDARGTRRNRASDALGFPALQGDGFPLAIGHGFKGTVDVHILLDLEGFDTNCQVGAGSSLLRVQLAGPLPSSITFQAVADLIRDRCLDRHGDPSFARTFVPFGILQSQRALQRFQASHL